jgi:hypothetical protein
LVDSGKNILNLVDGLVAPQCDFREIFSYVFVVAQLQQFVKHANSKIIANEILLDF